MIRKVLLVLAILALTGCASTIKGVSLNGSNGGSHLMSKNITDGNFFINRINNTSTGDASRLLEGRLIYPSSYYLEPGDYLLSVRHEGGGYQPITGNLNLVVEKGHHYVLMNEIVNEKMYFWIEDAKTKERVAGWKGE